MSDEKLLEWEREQVRKRRLVPDDSLRIRRDRAWIVVEGHVNGRKVGYRITQEQHEQMTNEDMQDYLIGIQERDNERR